MMSRRHRRIFPRHGMGRLTESGPSGSALGYADYWPLTVTPQAQEGGEKGDGLRWTPKIFGRWHNDAAT